MRSGLTTLPDGLSWRHILGVGALAGIGFTMSLFITNLAFGGTELLSTAKLGILAASVVAGLLGWELLRRAPVTSTSADSTVNPPLRRQARPG